jgi:predicted DNA-binding protein
MSKRPEGNMVLRSIYLPEELDSRLRSIAFLQGRSKGELVRELVSEGLERLEEKAVARSRDDRSEA